jgi:hypothetical protein
MSLRGALVIGVCLATLMPAASAVGQEAMKVSASAKAACIPDALRYCREAMPNIRSVVVCIVQNRSKISGRCNAVLASYGL